VHPCVTSAASKARVFPCACQAGNCTFMSDRLDGEVHVNSPSPELSITAATPAQLKTFMELAAATAQALNRVR